jgi:hypothetical protein
MNDRDRQPGPDKSPSGPREANDPGSTRYGKNPGSGSNEPKRNERKETDRGFESRQGGDQTRAPANQDPQEEER